MISRGLYTQLRIRTKLLTFLLCSVAPGNQPGAAALENLAQQSETSFTWNVDIAAGELAFYKYPK